MLLVSNWIKEVIDIYRGQNLQTAESTTVNIVLAELLRKKEVALL